MADLQTLLGDAYKDGMTVEEINASLAERDFVSKDSLADYVPKSKADQYASEAAEYKKKWKATQTAQEQKALEETERQQAMENELKELRRTSKISEYKSQHLALGYDEKSATSISEALYDGDMDTVFGIQKMFNDNLQKNIKADLMKSMPTPPSGNGGSNIDLTKQIADAQASGNMALYASLIRQQNEANAQKNV